MKTKIKFKYVSYITGLLAAIFFYFYLDRDQEKTKIREDVEYPFINKNSNDYKGIITKRSISGIYKGTQLFELSTGQKFSASGFNFLEVGDSIHRPMNADSIYIFYQTGKQSKLFLFRESK